MEATGIEDPTRWLGLGTMDIRDAPEFFFEIETKRIARDLDPGFKANIPGGIGSERAYHQQTDEVDLADFEAALKAGALHPPDAEKALAEHKATIAAFHRVAEDEKSDDAKPKPVDPKALAAGPEPVEAEFPSEFADYHRGATAYRADDTAGAQKSWKALLERPPAERKYRTTWAAYMLGKIALDEKRVEDARGWFKKVREEAKGGAVDSLGLASASIGWEAYMELDARNFPRAARLYLQQLATGDPTAVNSLLTVISQFTEAQRDPEDWMRDPVMQRLATAAALSNIGLFDEPSPSADHVDAPTRWLKLLEAADAKKVKDADCVAWLEYQKGDFKVVDRWLKIADPTSPYALWLRAKLALREGKIDVAAQLLSKAVPQLPAQSELEARSLEFETMPGDMSKGDLGATLVARGDFLSAVKLFVQVRNCDDATYLAEAILTLPELKKYVEELPIMKKPEEGKEVYDQPVDLRKLFGEVLGRRLVRAGKFAEARPYFEKDDQDVLDQYVELLKTGDNASAPKPRRADALWQAAQLIGEKGGALYDFSLPVEMVGRLAGHNVQEAEAPSSPSRIVLGDPIQFLPPVTETEKKRLRENSTPAVHRFHSSYVAADLGWRAAQLLPDNDDQTVTILNTAGSWLKHGDDKAADRFYQAIERRCPKTEIGKEAVKHHWFVE